MMRDFQTVDPAKGQGCFVDDFQVKFQREKAIIEL